MITTRGRKSLTPHQREVYERLTRHYFRKDGSTRPVPESNIGSVGALNHLRAKGYAAVQSTEYGPRGGEFRYWVPIR